MSSYKITTSYKMPVPEKSKLNSSRGNKEKPPEAIKREYFWKNPEK